MQERMESQQPRVLIIQPDVKDDASRLGAWLSEAGLQLDIVAPFLGDRIPSRVSGDGVVVLGGSMGALDDDAHPWLADIRRLIRDAVNRNIPTLGICLGAQLLAVATGGCVGPGHAGLECGVVGVRWTNQAVDDPLVTGLSTPFVAATMHFDAIEQLPAGAVLLGETTTYPHQVFRVGSAWGVQFHPEVTPERYASWRSEMAPSARAMYDGHARQVDSADSEIQVGTRELARRFAAVVHAGARP
jgi:GMP synthase (glutamine-hydrolysing)